MDKAQVAEIIVLGAGMVGVCTAIELQSRGHSVTLVDNHEPGTETSHGNAGVIQAEAVEPYALPREFGVLADILLGRTNDVTWSLSGLMSMALPLARYFLCSATDRHADISRIYSQLIQRATEHHAKLIVAAKAESLIVRQGLADVYRSQVALERQAKDLARVEQAYGVKSRVLDEAAYKREEPAITGTIAGAIHWPQSWSCKNPQALTQKYAEIFTTGVGQLITANAEHVCQRGSGWSLTASSGRTINAEHVVVCLGPWSPLLLRQFEYRIPMIYKRGYHAHYAAQTPVTRPFLDVSNGVVATSVHQGLRVTSGVALVQHGAPANVKQLNRGAIGLSEIMHVGPQTQDPVWFGTRPCMPDMLPLVGQAPRHANLWFNFGHGHQGFTLGPTSARYLADAFEGDKSDVGSALSPQNRIAAS